MTYIEYDEFLTKLLADFNKFKAIDLDQFSDEDKVKAIGRVGLFCAELNKVTGSL